MRRFFVTLSLVSLLGCADDSGGPRVATGTPPAAATGAGAPTGAMKPDAGKGVSTPSAAPTVGDTATLRP
ncbi:MAG TPA: hypothetical protein VGH33_10950 [Isosphaeraceae bacterium]